MVFIFGAILHHLGALDEFIVYTSSASSLKEAYTAGVYKYLHTDLIFIFVPLAVWKIFAYVADMKKYKIRSNLLPYIYSVFIFLYPLAFFINRLLFKQMSELDFLKIQFRDEFATITFLLACIVLLFYSKKFSNVWGLVLLLFLSWSSSISWAHTTPHLFSTPIIMIFAMSAEKLIDLKNISNFLKFLLVLGLTSYFIGYQKPHYSDMRSNVVFDLSHVGPNLKNIKGDKKIFDKLVEIDFLARKYGNNIKVLPFMPLFNFLKGTNSPLSIDYGINCEIADQEQKIYSELVNNRMVVLVDKGWWTIEESIRDYNRMYGSKLAYRVIKEWTKIDSTNRYCVYKFTK